MRSAKKRRGIVVRRSSAACAAIVIVLATCRETTAPEQNKPPVFLAQRITCAVNHTAKSVTCTSGASGISSSRAQAIANAKLAATSKEAPGMSAAILGGQNVYVRLTAQNVVSDPDNFNFDAEVQNLTPQPMNTADGINPETGTSNGVNVFFDIEPAAPITIVGDQCCITGTAMGQDYFNYVPDAILAANDSTTGQNWEFDYNGPAVDFTFTVYVSTRLPNDPALVVIPAHSFTQIATGVSHSCGVRSGNVGYCWGDNNNGEVGIGTFNPIPNLEPVGVIANLSFAQIVAGQFFSCGLTTGNAAYCWGDGDSASLGNGDPGDNFPVAVGGVETYKQISTLTFTVCAIEVGAGDQQLQCWGSNEHGQAGTGSASTLINTPTNVTVGGGMFSQVSVGATHTCAVKANGDTWCWGSNGSGELGQNTHGVDIPNPSTKIAGQSFASVAAGKIFSCAVDGASKAWCWGDGTLGQLGNGFFSSESDAPAAVVGGHLFTPAIAAGWFNACAIETAAAHHAFCWGDNTNGQIGNGGTTDQSSPVQVSNVSGFAEIGLGDDIACAVTTANVPYCWGYGANGAIGNGSLTTMVKTPAAVALP